jgi:hypothetical protein
VKLAEHFVHRVDDGLGLILFNIVPAVLDHTVHAARRKMRQSLVMGVPLLSKVPPKCPFRPVLITSARKNDERLISEVQVVGTVVAVRKG